MSREHRLSGPRVCLVQVQSAKREDREFEASQPLRDVKHGLQKVAVEERDRDRHRVMRYVVHVGMGDDSVYKQEVLQHQGSM